VTGDATARPTSSRASIPRSTNPRGSVVTPSYNNVGFIEAMDSILGQMFEGAGQHTSTTPHQPKTKAERPMIDVEFLWVREKANTGSHPLSHSSGWRHPLSTLMAVFLEPLPCDRLAGVQGEQ